MSFNFLNIPVHFHPTFWIFLMFFSFQPNMEIIEMALLGGALTLSLLFHEYGHALTALYYGAKPEITLQAFGGYASYQSSFVTKKQQFWITLNGPVFTLLLILGSHYLLKGYFFQNYHTNLFLYFMKNLNILWLIINLAPLLPLDGGQLLSYLLEFKLSEKKGQRIGLMIGNITAVLGAAYFVFYEYYCFAALFIFYGFQNLQTYQHLGFSKKETSNFNLYNNAMQAKEEKKTEKAKTILQKILKSKDNYLKTQAVEELAEIHYEEKEYKRASDLLSKQEPRNLKKGKLLLCKMAYLAKNYSFFEKHSRDAYEEFPVFETALLNSKAFAGLNHPKLSGQWLKVAFEFNDPNMGTMEEILKDPIYQGVKNHDAFQQHVLKYQI